MRRLLWGTIVGSAMALGSVPADAQVAVAGDGAPFRLNPYFAAPGYYGTTYGAASFGMTRTYSVYSSSYGLGYGAGYAPYGLPPGRYGVGLWRPGIVSPGYVYGASYYGTFAVPGAPAPPPPIGLYAPGFGAPSPPSYYAR